MKNFILSEFLVLLVAPLLHSFSLNLGGQLAISDVVCLSTLPWLINKRSFKDIGATAKIILALVLLWLCGAVITDLYRNSSPLDFERGWAKIIFLAIDIAALVLAADGKIIRIVYFCAAYAAGTVLGYFVAPTEYGKLYPWKFGFGDGVTLFGVVLSCVPLASRKPNPTISILGLCMLSALDLVVGNRSMFGLVLAAAGATAITHFRRRLRNPILEIAVCIAFAAIVVSAATYSYSSAASTGILGPVALAKYQTQTAGGNSILLGGRSEWLASQQAVADSPIVGHGSWARDRTYVVMALSRLRWRGIDAIPTTFNSDLIPTHSYLFGSWVEHGIAGAIFWVVCGCITLLALCYCILRRVSALPLFTFLLCSLLWDIMFSPFGSGETLFVSCKLCIATIVLNAAPQDLRLVPQARFLRFAY